MTRRVVAIGEAMVQMAPTGPRRYAQGFAGDTFNTAWHLAQLLGDRADVAFLTRIGTDGFSDSFAAELAADGLDPSAVGRDPERRMGLYVIELQDGERSFHYWRDASAARRLADDPAVLRRGLAGATLVYVSGITLAILDEAGRSNLLSALAEARAGGARVAFDPNVRPRLWASPDETRHVTGRMLQGVDIALPSFDDEATLWGDASPDATLARLAAAGVAEAVVKNGAAPVCFRTAGSAGTVPTPLVAALVDTTGAGDAFNAGFLAARMLGSPCADAIAWGQRLSAEVIATLGACAERDSVRRMGADLPAG